MHRYVDLVQDYLRDGQEATLATIGALRESLLNDNVPIEELVSLHERAMLELKHLVTPDNFGDIVTKTTTCLTELLIAYSLADFRKKDLHERHQRMERERQRLEALGQMAGGVAHEFNNLLQPILGMTELALEDVDLKSELAEQLRVIQTCATKAVTIVRGILTTGRQQGPPPRPLPLAPLLKKTVQFLSAIMPAGIRLDLSIICGSECVRCEEAELAQVILNLVRNAGDALNGKGTVRIILHREDRQISRIAADEQVMRPSLKLIVADDGSGMPPEVVARAFQPFFTTKAPNEGTGLGLPIVMAIVLGWNGTLHIDSEPRKGTRISIDLPIEPESSAAASR